MLIVAALGGNALLKRGEPLTAEAQRTNVQTAAKSLAELVRARQRPSGGFAGAAGCRLQTG